MVGLCYLMNVCKGESQARNKKEDEVEYVSFFMFVLSSSFFSSPFFVFVSVSAQRVLIIRSRYSRRRGRSRRRSRMSLT
jgi:hypothetical protein